MNKTGIAWTEHTSNPWSGCTKVSPGCFNCYAEEFAERLRGTDAFPVGFELTIREHELEALLKRKKPSLIFLESMSDFFWEAVSDELRDRVMDVVEQTPQHQYQILTKRPGEMLRYTKRRQMPRNVWLGVTVESQDYVSRIDILREADVAVRFLSCEPLLSPLELNLNGISWVIVGGESGSHLFKPEIRAKRSLVDYDPKTKQWTPHPDRHHWVSSLRDQCIDAKVPFFFKQWGGCTPKSAGNLLDGKTWEEYPRLPEQINIDVDVEDTMRQSEQSVESPRDYQLTEAESAELTALETTIERGLQTFWEVGEALFTIRDKRLYRATHATFDAYCRERWQMSKTQANRLIGAADVAKDLAPIGVIPSSESVARPLVSLPPEQRQEVWQKAVDSAVDGKPTAADVAQVAKEIKQPSQPTIAQSVDDTGDGAFAVNVESSLPEVLADDQSDQDTTSRTVPAHAPFVSSKSDEHYTPKEIVDAVLELLGTIDLDPCSNSHASPNVPAKRLYTQADDGLSKPWQAATVFMNPPYSDVERWVNKLCDEYAAGNIGDTIALVKGDTSTQWFQRIWEHAGAVCFPHHRLRFLNGDATQKNSATFASAVVYLGYDLDPFFKAFEGKVGVCVRRLEKFYEIHDLLHATRGKCEQYRQETLRLKKDLATLEGRLAAESASGLAGGAITATEPSPQAPDEVSDHYSKTLTRQELAELKGVTAEAVRLREKKGIKRPKEIKGTLKEWGYEVVPESSPRRYRKI